LSAKKKTDKELFIKNNSSTMAFAAELLGSSVAVPKLLLENYSYMGYSDIQFIYIIGLLGLQREKGCFSAEDSAGILNLSLAESQAVIDSLIVKGAVVKESGKTDCYNLSGLFAELYERWAYGKSKSGCELKTDADIEAKSHNVDPLYADLYKKFEKEFVNGLSPLQGEKLAKWLFKNKIAPELIEEALNRAVLQGKVSFSYIDKILLNWQKQNLLTLADVEARDDHPAVPVRKKTKVAQDAVVPEYASIYDDILKF